MPTEPLDLRHEADELFVWLLAAVAPGVTRGCELGLQVVESAGRVWSWDEVAARLVRPSIEIKPRYQLTFDELRVIVSWFTNPAALGAACEARAGELLHAAGECP